GQAGTADRDRRCAAARPHRAARLSLPLRDQDEARRMSIARQGDGITPKPELYESILLHDRPSAWWGLDTADPTVDDSGHSYTLTAVGAPANTATLLTRGDGGLSGCRDFGGTADAYKVSGTVTSAPLGPPPFAGSTSGQASAATV